MNADWKEFEREIFESSQGLGRFQTMPFADSTPSDIRAGLELIDKSITTALQLLRSLDLVHRDKQDLETQPYNWPVAQALQHSRGYLEWERTKGATPDPELADPTYPSKLLADMAQLRDVARRAADSIKVTRGNSGRRTARAARILEVGNHVVFSYRSKFGTMPPISKTGRVVDLMEAALHAAGIEDVDAAVVLRSAIERDSVGRSLLLSAADSRADRRRTK